MDRSDWFSDLTQSHSLNQSSIFAILISVIPYSSHSPEVFQNISHQYHLLESQSTKVNHYTFSEQNSPQQKNTIHKNPPSSSSPMSFANENDDADVDICPTNFGYIYNIEFARMFFIRTWSKIFKEFCIIRFCTNPNPADYGKRCSTKIALHRKKDPLGVFAGCGWMVQRLSCFSVRYDYLQKGWGGGRISVIRAVGRGGAVAKH